VLILAGDEWTYHSFDFIVVKVTDERIREYSTAMRSILPPIAFIAFLVVLYFMLPAGMFGINRVIAPVYPIPETPIVPPADDGPDVEAILKRMEAVYAEAKSYRDLGVIETVYFTGGLAGQHAGWTPFRTEFVRPDRLRFEYETFDHPTAGGFGHEVSAVVWRDGEQGDLWWTLERIELPDRSPTMGFHSANGVTQGASTRIARLLTPGEWSWTGLGLQVPTLIGRQVVDGVDCFRIEDRQPLRQTGTSIVWIDVERYLVRRVLVEYMEQGEVQSRIMTVYRPELDAAIDESRFSFSPPQQTRPRKRIGLFDRSAMTDTNAASADSSGQPPPAHR
jgi:hypothetical protein